MIAYTGAVPHTQVPSCRITLTGATQDEGLAAGTKEITGKVEVSGIGILSNPVKDEVAAAATRAA